MSGCVTIGSKLLRFVAPEPGRVVGLAWRRTSTRKADFLALGQLISETLGFGGMQKNA
jgi:LysR family hydrogen peroxide-inducible transcriptional activator